MGFLNTIKDQFVDVIEYIDEDNKTIVKKYTRQFKDNDEIKTGAKVIVRPSQAGVFFKGGQFADILKEGTHRLTTDNLPVLSTLMAFPHLFNSPLKADLYFISLRQFVGNRWATKNPIIIRDKEFKMVRIRAIGAYAFKINNVEKFVREVLGTQKRFETPEILEYLNSYIVESFNVVLGEVDIPIIDLTTKYAQLSKLIQIKANIKAKEIGIQFSNINIENISLPENVERLIDEQSGIGMASNNMSEFIQYQSARAIRDAASQSGGVAGLCASVAVGKNIAKTMMNDFDTDNSKVKVRCSNCGTLNGEKVKFCSECGEPLNGSKEKKKVESTKKESTENNKDYIYEKLREYKELLDDGILNQEEFEELKDKLLNNL